MAKVNPEKSFWGILFSRPFRRMFCMIMAFNVAAVILRCASPLIQKYLIDAVTNYRRDKLLIAIIALALVLFGTLLLETFSGWLCGKFLIQARNFLKGSIFRHLLTLPEDFLLSRGAGYFFNRIQNDIGEVLASWRSGIFSMLTDSLKLLIAWIAIACVNIRCAFFVIPFLLIQGWICFRFRKRQYRLSRNLQECVASERHVMQEFLAEHRAVKTHSALQKASDRVETGLSRWSDLARRRLSNEYLFRSCMQLPVWTCTGIIAIYELFLVMEKSATLGDAWALITLTMLIFAPSRTLGGIFVQMESARSAWHRLGELRQIKGENDGAAETSAPVRLDGDIVFDDVAFGYGETELFDHISFAVPGGELLFLRGTNGSGKSTLLALFMRLFDLKSGQITVGGKNIGAFPLAAYRSRIGYIGQHPEFIKGSVRDNLLLGNNALADETLTDMLQKLGIWQMIASRGGLDAEVRESGNNFSGGEKLRLALARELLRDTDILLFDEPAAHLDSQGREQFYLLIQSLHGKKSVIAAVHETLMKDFGRNFVLPERD